MEYRFSEIVEINPRESIPRGRIAKKIAMQNLTENAREIQGFVEEAFKGGSKFRQGDTLFARITPCLENGKIAQVNILDNGEVAFGSTELLVFRAREGISLPDYVYHLSKWDYVRQLAVKSMTGTSGRQRVQNSVFDEIMIDLPSIEGQQRIVGILNAFDQKIELNNKIIANLEAQAKAIFKSWFIDFEPFQDGEFIESELGLIPEGWEINKLGDLFRFVKGKKVKEESQGDCLVHYLVKGVVDGTVEPKFVSSDNAILIDSLDPFMLMDGANSGNIYYGFKGALGSTFSLLEVKTEELREIIYWFLKLNEVIIKNQNTGSAIPHANKDFINSMLIVLPSDEKAVLKAVNMLRTCRKKTFTLKEQNRTLAQIRDTLLPKLMSGEIDVSSIKIDSEEIGHV